MPHIPCHDIRSNGCCGTAHNEDCDQLLVSEAELVSKGNQQSGEAHELKEGRADDASEDIINNRIVTYHNQTEPLIEYYDKVGKYNEIDGVGSIEEVQERIFNVMNKFQNPKNTLIINLLPYMPAVLLQQAFL